MIFLKKISRLFLNKYFFQKVIAYILLIGVIIILKDFLLILFLTFVFSYLFLNFGEFLEEKLNIFFKKIARGKTQLHFLQKIFGLHIIILFLYIIFIGAIFFALSDLIPQLLKELKDLPKYLPILKEPLDMLTGKLEEIKNINSQIGGSFSQIISKQDMDLIMQFVEKLKTFGAVFIQILIALILSYIFIIDRKTLGAYLKGIKNSNFGFLYREYQSITDKIVRTFGLVFKAQSMIALVNTFLTIIGISIIGAIHGGGFPFLYTLAIITFISGFIPVLGVFISSLPILLIGYSTFGGIGIIIEIIVLILIIHSVEAYYLNPKIVSSYTKLPLSLTFLVLILSEYLFGFVGLVIGISSFYLILELLKDADKIITKGKNTFLEMEDVEKKTKQEIKSKIRLSRKINE